MSLFELIVLALIVYWIFKPGKKTVSHKKSLPYDDTMLPCTKCGVYISSREGFKWDQNFFCSKSCAKGELT